MAFSRYLFSKNKSIVDFRLGSTFVSGIAQILRIGNIILADFRNYAVKLDSKSALTTKFNQRHWMSEAVVQRCSVKKMFLKISQNSQENTRVAVFFDKVANLRPATLLKNRLRHRWFPVNFAKFLKTSFLIEHLCWLFLKCFIILPCFQYCHVVSGKLQSASCNFSVLKSWK